MSVLSTRGTSGLAGNDGEILLTSLSPRLQLSLLNRNPQDGFSSGRAVYTIRVRVANEFWVGTCPLVTLKVFATGGDGAAIFERRLETLSDIFTPRECYIDVAIPIEKSKLNSKYNSVIFQIYAWDFENKKWIVRESSAYRVDNPISFVDYGDQGGIFGSGEGSLLGNLKDILRYTAIGGAVLAGWYAFGPLVRAASSSRARQIDLASRVSTRLKE